MKYIPPKVDNIKPYGFEDATGCKVKLDANESFVSLPEYLRKKLAKIALSLEYNRYPDPLALKAISAYSKYIGVAPEYITAGNGSDELISIIINSLQNRGDKLMLCDPDFSMYRFYAGLAEVICLNTPKKPDYTVNTDKLLQEVKKNKPSAVIFSNPCSPTGLALKKEEILRLTQEECLWIIDEAYMDFWDQSIADIAIKRDNVIVLRTCSKAFGLAGLRLGFAICCEELTGALRKAKSPANINALTCEMAAEVISDRDFIEKAKTAIIKSTAHIYEEITRLKRRYEGEFRVCPTVTNFVYILPEKAGDAGNLWLYLREKGVLIRKLGNALRITAGTQAENNAFLSAFESWLAENTNREKKL